MFPVTRRLFSRQGQFSGVLWRRILKCRKGVSSLVTKEVRTCVRAGIDYDKRQAVQEARAEGALPSVNAGLPWGEWFAFPYVITHKGAYYLRLYPVNVGDKSRAPRVVYRENGAVSTRERAKELCLASEFGETTEGTCYTLKAESLVRVR